jgi:hypothetical protein
VEELEEFFEVIVFFRYFIASLLHYFSLGD